jgi:hypothetical protein
MIYTQLKEIAEMPAGKFANRKVSRQIVKNYFKLGVSRHIAGITFCDCNNETHLSATLLRSAQLCNYMQILYLFKKIY